MKKRKKYYIGITNVVTRQGEIFLYENEPTEQTHGHKYMYVIGPFTTKKAAVYMIDHPYCSSVYDAEKLKDIPLYIKYL
jgi:hypothetical protein